MAQCRDCLQEFEIRKEDQDFYAQLDVPAPQLCPRCREMRRMAWCNEMYLYPNNCGLCGKKIIAQFGIDNPRVVYCVSCWWSDKWNSLDYGKEIDWDKSFFEQLHELELSVPHCCVSVDIGAENSEYTHHAGQEKNCYLIFHSTFAEDCYYGYGLKKAKNCVDVHYGHSSSYCYECIDIKDCYNLLWSQDCTGCGSSYFLKDCINCVDCFMCVGLRNKKYCFQNEQLTQEEYTKKMSEINLGSYVAVQNCLKEFETIQLNHPYKYIRESMAENSLGDYIYNTRNSYSCFDVSDAENSAYCSQMQLGVKSCYDIYQYGVDAELCYEGAMIGTNAYKVMFSYLCLWQVSDMTYCIESYTSKNCFGSVGLKHNQYTILNKSYSAEEYSEIQKKLIEKMKRDGEYGEFLPPAYSQSAYNETTANLWYPLTKEQVIERGWRWQDALPGTYGQETLNDTPDSITAVADSIAQEVLQCELCTKNYKIISQELSFYRQLSIPLPRKCFECRRRLRMSKRSARWFWERQCMCIDTTHGHDGHCTTVFKTTYSPDRPETVYCETCYKGALY